MLMQESMYSPYVASLREVGKSGKSAPMLPPKALAVGCEARKLRLLVMSGRIYHWAVRYHQFVLNPAGYAAQQPWHRSNNICHPRGVKELGLGESS